MTKQSNINIMENGRAKFAYEAVKDLMENSRNKQSEIRSYIKRLPIMIQTNGLGQALAFYYSKGGQHGEIYKKISAWFSDNDKYSLLTINDELIEAIVKMDRATYRFVTNEVMELLNWMRRFADGYRSGEEKDK